MTTPPARPDVGRAPSLEPPPHTSYLLPNGLAVTLIPAGSLPKVHVRLLVRTGAVDEAPDQTWLSHLTAEMLKEGAGDLDAAAFADAMARLGGRLDVDVRDDATLLDAHVLSAYGPEAVRLIAEVARSPLLPASELQRLKHDLERRRAIAAAQPHALTLDRFRRQLYGDHPYGRVLPVPGTIDAFTLDHVQRFYGEGFGAARTHLYIAGQFDHDTVTDAIRAAFADWSAGAPPAPVAVHAHDAASVHLLDRPGAEQSTLYLGLPVPDPTHEHFVALSVLNTLIGGAFMSRITMNIRERKGYTYSPRSELSTRHRSAYWLEVADVTTNVTGAALDEIYSEIERLRAEPPAHDELTGIHNYMAGAFILSSATPRGLVEERAFLDIHHLTDDYLRSYVDRVYAVTPEQVQLLAQTYLDPARMTLVVAGDAAHVAPQLSPFGSVITH